ncbi:MAG: preprotein translocase subunit SecA [Gammaproteobacteria bacterium]|nr:preprotein translocase subunit SecA [Gammaproteobacteria bacterium]MDE0248555.1 preprotein translocase subunit SecA [Gammaproteobacteria bacterium]
MGIKGWIKRVIGSQHDREVRRLLSVVEEVNEIYGELSEISDEDLGGKTLEFRTYIAERVGDTENRIREARERKAKSTSTAEREALSVELSELEATLGDELEAALDDLLPEAFAVVKEVCRRLVGREIIVTGQRLVWDMIPYDVQIVGAIALHRGTATEMATGEGKTLAATMPLYLNALAGRGAHLVTVNSYLAERDAAWMGEIYSFLGLEVGVIDLHQPGTEERRTAYRADITYGTNNEFGFDYLRDNMVHSLDRRVQRGHHFAIIDEVDSILIDEARTPLIISGPVRRDTQTSYKQYRPLVDKLYREQLKTASRLIADAERALDEGDDWSAAQSLLAVKRGTPKHKRLLKMFADDPSIQKAVQKAEAELMREKRLHELDESLLFAMDEKGHNVHLSDQGIDRLSPGDPDAFLVPDLSEMIGEIEDDEELTAEAKRTEIDALEGEYARKSERMHVIHQLLKAYVLFHRDEQYIIGEDGQIVIVDEFTGRQMAGRRWSDGLHQAVEAKEGVQVRGETQTLATITIQNYFRMYGKLSGMTGTAETEEHEFHQIYGLDVLVIPTNRPVIRDDLNDLIFQTKREKYNGLMDEIERCNRMELPVLVGTTNVEVSETLSRMLKRRGIRHNVLNAKQHRREADIVAEAGQPGAVTVATNMAGRGTDIKLGPGVTEPRTVGWARSRGLDLGMLAAVDPTRWRDYSEAGDAEVIEEGGLRILGSERHESRRIDRQLRGRAGRQGDPGASQFFLSLEDDLMRVFGSERVATIMDKLGGADEGDVITHGFVTKSIEKAQKRVEGNNFEARKRLLDYDDVMNQQREVIYDLRLFALEGGEDLRGEVFEMVETAVTEVVDEHADGDPYSVSQDLGALRRRLLTDFFIPVEDLPTDGEGDDGPYDRDELLEVVLPAVTAQFGRKLETFAEHSEQLQRWILLSVIDNKWKDHLYDLDALKASISFRGWGQKDPLIEYKKEAYDMFVDLMRDIRRTVTGLFFRAQIGQARTPAAARGPERLQYSGPRELAGTGVASPGPGPASPRPAAPIRGRPALVGAGAGRGAPPPSEAAAMGANRAQARPRSPVTVAPTPGRNQPCPCGSGKKYKKCHGRPS